MKNIGGTVIADTLNKDITATFSEPVFDYPMIFRSMNGNLDVTFFKKQGFSFKVSAEYGEFYNDFKTKISRDKKTKWITGKINSGGPDIKLDSFNGNIYLRSKN